MAEEQRSGMFQRPEETRSGFSLQAVLVAAGVIALALGISLFAGLLHRPASVPSVPDGYAAKLPISQVMLLEATNGAGGRSTYVDGRITNTGAEVIRGITVRSRFATNDGSAPHVEVLPLSLIRTREPYVDLQPVAAAPIRPGESREFRLIFEGLPASWDVQPPSVTIVQTTR